MKVTSTVSLTTQKKYIVDNPLTMVRACGIVELNGVRPLPSGNFSVHLTSRPNLFHLINPRHESCNCEAGQKETMCVHLIAWLLWRAQCFEDARDTVIATREARVALIEKRPRTEWVEEY